MEALKDNAWSNCIPIHFPLFSEVIDSSASELEPANEPEKTAERE